MLSRARLLSEHFHCITLLLLLLRSYNSSAAASTQPIPPMTTTTRATNSNKTDTAAVTAPLSSTFKHVVFSDIDGTLAHYPGHLQEGSGIKDSDNDGDINELICFPPSKTGTRGVLSTRTLQLCHQLRHGKVSEIDSALTTNSTKQQRICNGGVALVLISGMRTSTLFQRLPYLPQADAYVSESGGRIFYPHEIPKNEETDIEGLVQGLIVHPVPYPGISNNYPFCLIEDTNWRDNISQLHAAGNDGYDNSFPVEKRRGKLWELARTHTKHGYVLDISGYATAYRINRKHQPTHLALTFNDFIEEAVNKQGLSNGLSCSTNLGCVDIYPDISGKKNCAKYLIHRFLGHGEQGRKSIQKAPISLKTHAYFLCDDNNDIELALACRAAYFPSVASESIHNLVTSMQRQKDGDTGKLVITEDKENGIVGPLATEAALEAIMRKLW